MRKFAHFPFLSTLPPQILVVLDFVSFFFPPCRCFRLTFTEWSKWTSSHNPCLLAGSSWLIYNFPAKNAEPECHHPETSDKQNEDFIQHDWPGFFQKSSHKRQRKAEETFQVKKTKKTWQLSEWDAWSWIGSGWRGNKSYKGWNWDHCLNRNTVCT